MTLRGARLVMAGLVLAAGSAAIPPGAPAAQEQGYAYGMFRISGYALEDPARGYCGAQCKVPNRQLNSSYVHSPIFRLPDPGQRIDLWATGNEFCRRARRQMGESWWTRRGMPDCRDGFMNYFTTQERAVDELQKLYRRAATENRPDFAFEVYEFGDFQNRHVTLAVLRFPGAVPAPVAAPAAVPAPRTQPGDGASLVPVPAPPVPNALDLAEIATRERLNREQAEFAARQLADNAAAKAGYERAVAERAAIIAAQAAEAERAQRAHDAAMAQWREDVAACQRSTTAPCVPQP